MGGGTVPERKRITEDLAKEMAALHGVGLEPDRVAGMAADVEINVRKLEQVSEERLRDVQPAFIQPLKVRGGKRR